MKNGIRVTICVMLVVAVLAMSLSVFADNEPNPTPTVPPEQFDPLMELNYRAAMQIIYNCLNAWGIEVEYNGYREFGDELNTLLTNWVLEFLDSLPSQYTISTWIAPWQASYDYWGNARYNESALDDIQSFVDWLITKFGLTNTGTLVVNPNYSVNGYTIYELGVYYPLEYTNGRPNYAMDWVAINYDNGQNNNNPVIGYIQIFRTDNNNTPVIYFISANGTPFIFDGHVMYQDGTIQGGYGGRVNMYLNNNVNGYYMSDPIYLDPRSTTALAITGGNDFYCNGDQFNHFISNFNVEIEGTTKIVTDNMLIPVEDPNYTPGDSITIVDGEPEYSIIEFPDSISVNNLPAVVSTSTLTNPGLDTFWGFIPVLAEQTKDAIILTRGLIYELPEEIVVTFYAVMGGLILFGIIKLMREH